MTSITMGSVLIYLLILFRVLGCVMSLPFFGRGMAVVLKGAFTVILAFLLFPSAALEISAPALDPSYLLLVMEEVLIGLMMGFVVRICFGIILVAGEMASQEIGFRMSQQVDPITGNNTPVIAQFYQIIAFVSFLTLNGHYYILAILARSFEAVPLATFKLQVGFGEWLAQLFSRFFTMGIQMAAPIFLLMLMISIGVGLLSKLVDGINVMDIGFPIRIGVGLIFLMFFISFMGQTLNRVYSEVQTGLIGLLMTL